MDPAPPDLQEQGAALYEETEATRAVLQEEQHALMRQIRTSAGSEQFVKAVIQHTLLSRNCDWGQLLSSAPRALMCLGQCFVVASSPLAATLHLPEGMGLEAKSLRGNLTHCSHLGRAAFREAEAKMGNLNMIAQSVCGSNGTIEKILTAVEDDDLAEIELPDLIDELRSVSKECIEDTQCIREKMVAWQEYAVKMRKACEDQTLSVASKEKELQAEVVEKEITRHAREVDAKGTREEAENQKKSLKRREKEYDDAASELYRGEWFEFATGVANAAASIASDAISSLPYLSYLSYLQPLAYGGKFATGKAAVHNDSYSVEREDTDESSDDGKAVDPALKLSEGVLPQAESLLKLLSLGNERKYHGLDWEALSRQHEDQPNSASRIGTIAESLQSCQKSNKLKTPRSRELHVVVDSLLKIVGELRKLLDRQTDMSFSPANSIIKGDVHDWKRQVENDTKKAAGIKEEISKETKMKRSQKKTKDRNGNVSRAEMNFTRLKLAQEALEQAEEVSEQKSRAEHEANKEFDEVQRELSALANKQVTVAEVRKILNRCIDNLGKFANQLDNLNKFFRDIHDFVKRFNNDSVHRFMKSAETARKIIDKASSEDRERKKQQRLDVLKIDALQLRGFYLVAQAMATTYVDISAHYIIPGVKQVDLLGIASEEEVPESMFQSKIESLERYSQEAQSKINNIAQQRKLELLNQLGIDDRGEIEEVDAKAIQSVSVEREVYPMPGGYSTLFS